MSRGRGFAWGTAYGALTWATYAVVEYCAVSAYPFVSRLDSFHPPQHWMATGLLFVLYLLFGSLLGGLVSMVVGRARKTFDNGSLVQARAAILATLGLAFVLHFVLTNLEWISRSRGHMVLVFLLITLVVMLVGATVSSRWAGQFHFLINPWFVSLMLVGLPWLGKGFIPGRSGIAQATAGFALVSALAGICLIIQKLLSRRACPPFLTARPVLWLSLQVTVVMVFAVTASVYLRQAASLEIPLRQDAPEMPEGPNLILVTMDTVRADHTSAYGYYRETTPTLEGLAAESTLYLNAIAPGDMTLSTHASIFTGLPVNWHGAHYSYQNPGGQPLAEGFDTLAEMLARNGYFTAGVVANHGYLGHWFQLDQGFDYYDERAPISFFPETPMGVLREALRRVLTIWFHPSFLTTIYRTAEEIHTETLKLIEELHKRNRPWFLFLNYMDAHTPYQPPPPFDTRFPGKNRLFTWPRYLEIKKKLLRQEYKLTLKEKQHLVSQYDGGIAYQDHYLGMLLDELIKRGLYEDSLIIVTSDHGEAFGERSLMEHAMSVYQDQVHVPLVVKYPNSTEELKVIDTVSLISILPTVLDAAGIDSEIDFPGRSLQETAIQEPTTVVSESYPHGLLPRPRFGRVERALFRDSYKFISSTAGKREFYDLSLDPNETHNLYNEMREQSEALENQLINWLKIPGSPSGESPPLDRQTEERLRSLGYVK